MSAQWSDASVVEEEGPTEETREEVASRDIMPALQHEIESVRKTMLLILVRLGLVGPA